MRKGQRRGDAGAVFLPDSPRRRRPLADAVHGEEGRLAERRGKECRTRVRLVVLGEDYWPLVVELARNEVGHPQFLIEPDRHGLDERGQPARTEGEMRLEDALELDERLVLEGNAV